MPAKPSWPTRLRQVDLYRERAAMAGASPAYTGARLAHMLENMFGQQRTEDTVTDEELLESAANVRQRLRRCELLLLKDDLIQDAMQDLCAMDEDALATVDALAPPPEHTIFGFETPSTFELAGPPGHDHTQCTEDTCVHVSRMLLSVVVPISSAQLVFDPDTPFPAFVGYSRLRDYEALFDKPADMDAATARSVAEYHAQGQLWLPSVAFSMRLPLDVLPSMDRLLRLALHRARQAVNTTPPKDARAAAATAGVRPRAARVVRTVELAPRQRPKGDAPATGRHWQLQYRSTTPEHWRHYRNEDGTLRKKILIKEFTRAAHKPVRPKGQQPGKVQVARKPKEQP